MPTSTTVDYSWAMLGFLEAKIGGIMTALNADVASKVPGAPVFEFMVGIPANVEKPTLAVDYVSDLPPKRSAQKEKLIGLSFKVMCILPTAGVSNPRAFAACRSRARDFITTLFDEDINSLTPKIDAGLIGVVSALEGARGGITDLYGMEMEDKVTRVRGWQLMYSVWFSLTTA